MRKILQPLMLAVIALCITACRGKEDYGLCILSDEVSVETNSQRFFPMHSVVKFPQALYVADYLNSIEFSLDSTTVVRKDELMEDTWSPMLEMIEDAREFSFRELLRLSLTESDNNACDLLFKLCGNPREVESYIKGLGFEGIEVSATERQMHDDISLSSQNRCTPSGMARLFLWFNAHKDDNEYIREVWDIMAECKTGTDRYWRLPSLSRIRHQLPNSLKY